jgi:hypothetical protein
MPFDTKNLIKALGGIVAPQYFNKTTDQYEVHEGSDGAAHVKLIGSKMELYGPTITERPAANAVQIGSVYCAVQTQQYWQSDGTNWVVI